MVLTLLMHIRSLLRDQALFLIWGSAMRKQGRVNIHVQLSQGRTSSFLLGPYLGEELLGQR